MSLLRATGLLDAELGDLEVLCLIPLPSRLHRGLLPSARSHAALPRGPVRRRRRADQAVMVIIVRFP